MQRIEPLFRPRDRLIDSAGDLSEPRLERGALRFLLACESRKTLPKLRFDLSQPAAEGGDELFSLVMPDYLFENVPWKSAPLGLEIAVKNVLVTLPFGEGLHTRDLLDVLQSELSPAHLAWLKREVWRGSVAYAVYTTLRTGSVHFGGVGAALSFSHTYQGKPIPRVVFHNLYAALLSLAAHARKVSQESGEWFGQADWLSSGEQ